MVPITSGGQPVAADSAARSGNIDELGELRTELAVIALAIQGIRTSPDHVNEVMVAPVWSQVEAVSRRIEALEEGP